MKYKKEIDSMFRVLKTPLITEEEFQETIKEVMILHNLTYHKLSEAIDEGVKKGYSVEYQVEVIKKMLSCLG